MIDGRRLLVTPRGERALLIADWEVKLIRRVCDLVRVVEFPPLENHSGRWLDRDRRSFILPCPRTRFPQQPGRLPLPSSRFVPDSSTMPSRTITFIKEPWRRRLLIDFRQHELSKGCIARKGVGGFTGKARERLNEVGPTDNSNHLVPRITGSRLMRFCSMRGTISSSGVSSTIVWGLDVITSLILRPVRADVLGRQAAFAEKELQPARPTFLGSSFSATQKVTFRHDADEFARGIEYRKAADPVQDHELRRLKYRGIEFYRHDISGHHVNRFHC